MQDQRVKQSLKVVNYIGVGVITMMLAGTVAFGIIPMRKRGHDDQTAAAELSASIQRLGELQKANARAGIAVEEAQRRLNEAETHLASGPPDSAFNKELSEVARGAGIRIENMPPVSAPRDAGAYKSVQVTIIGSGDWESCYKFLSGLRNMGRILRLDSVVMDSQDKEGRSRAADKVTCQMTVKFSTFYMER